MIISFNLVVGRLPQGNAYYELDVSLAPEATLESIDSKPLTDELRELTFNFSVPDEVEDPELGDRGFEVRQVEDLGERYPHHVRVGQVDEFFIFENLDYGDELRRQEDYLDEHMESIAPRLAAVDPDQLVDRTEFEPSSRVVVVSRNNPVSLALAGDMNLTVCHLSIENGVFGSGGVALNARFEHQAAFDECGAGEMFKFAELGLHQTIVHVPDVDSRPVFQIVNIDVDSETVEILLDLDVEVFAQSVAA